MWEEPIHVLLVEDNPADARLLREALRESGATGFSVTHALCLRVAAELVVSGRPDVILLDLTLPDATGMDTVKQMRALAPGVPIVILTGLADERLALEVLRCGAQDYLVKGDVGASVATRALRYAVERSRVERSLRASEERFRLMIEGVKDYAIFMLDVQGNVASWNRGAQRIKGYEAAEIVGRHFSCFYTPEDVQAGKPELHLKRAAEGQFECEAWRMRKDGSRYWADVIISTLRDDRGALQGFVDVTRDITQRKAIETELVRAKDAAEAANNVKDHFLAVLSHELRTPLTPVLAVVSELEKQLQLPDEVRADLSTIRRNVELEAHLIDDLLDITCIMRNKITLNPVMLDAHVTLRRALAVFQPEIDRRRMELTLTLHAQRHHVLADPSRLQQVFMNLLSNAVKFTADGGRISVASSGNGDGDGDGDGELRIQIQDTGVGIEPEILPRLFTAFEQGERTVTRRFGGLGLGLSIAKSLVEMQKGRITAASDGLDKGAVFAVVFPTVAGPQAQAPAAPTEPGARRPHLLVVEDHDDTRRAFAKILQRMGCMVTTAANAKEAMELADKNRFDLLLSDIGLPDGSGNDVMRYVKDRYQLRGIAISGFSQEDDIRRSYEAGFEMHLSKPVDLGVLEEAIRSGNAAGIGHR